MGDGLEMREGGAGSRRDTLRKRDRLSPEIPLRQSPPLFPRRNHHKIKRGGETAREKEEASQARRESIGRRGIERGVTVEKAPRVVGEREINLPAFFIRPPTPPPARNGERKDSSYLERSPLTPPTPTPSSQEATETKDTQKRRREMCAPLLVYALVFLKC